MRYEFEYFYEPKDENKPIRKLIVVCHVITWSDIHPSDSIFYSRHTVYGAVLGKFELIDAKSGFDVSNGFLNISDLIVNEFYELHRSKIIDQLRDEDLGVL